MGNYCCKTKPPANWVTLGPGSEGSSVTGVAGDASNGAEGDVTPLVAPQVPEVPRRREYSSSEKSRYSTMTREYRRTRCYSHRLRRVERLQTIPPWGDTGETLPAREGPLHLPERQSREEESSRPQYDPEVNRRVSLMQAGNTLNVEVDAMVFPNDPTLLDKYAFITANIFDLSSLEMKKECAWWGGCAEGEAVVTGGYDLPADNVIHTVVAEFNNYHRLASCYQSCLELVRLHGFRTVVFPCIYKAHRTSHTTLTLEDSIRVGLRTVREWMERGKDDYLTKVDRIIFCVSGAQEMDYYKQLLQIYFPVNPRIPDSRADHTPTDDVDKGDMIAGPGSTSERENSGSDPEGLSTMSTDSESV